jgi:hypothetical protein
MLVIFHVNVIDRKNLKLSHIYHIFVEKNSIFEMKIFKFVTWYPNMVQICEIIWFNVSWTFIKTKNHLNCFWNIFLFFGT